MASNGRIWRVKIKNSIGNYVTFAGVKEESLTFGNKAIDITDKQSDGYRYQLARGGQSADLSCSGVAIDNDGYHIIKRAVRDNTFVELLMESEYDRLLGSFHISNYSEDAAHDGAVNFTASFSSTAAYTYQIPFQVVANGVLDSGATFTRASTATYFGSDGLLKTAAVNEARNEFDPVTGDNLGLLVEQQATNNILHSEDFDNAAWIHPNLSVNSNTKAAPDGTTTADDVVAGGGAGAKEIYQNFSAYNAGAAFSVYAKANTLSFLQIYSLASGAGAVNFDLTNGTQNVVSGGTDFASSITPVGNGWYRCTYSLNFNGDNCTGLVFSLVTSLSAVRAEADNFLSGAITLWGAQYEQQSLTTSYTPTAASAVTRSADIANRQIGSESNALEYSYVVEAVRGNHSGTDDRFLGINNGGSSERHVLFIDPSSADKTRLFTASVAIGSFNLVPSPIISSGQKFKFAFSMSSTRSFATANGSGGDSGISGLPDLTTENIGHELEASFFNGHILNITKYPRALSDARLVELSTL